MTLQNIRVHHVVLLLLGVSLSWNVYFATQLQAHLDGDENNHNLGLPSQRQRIARSPDADVRKPDADVRQPDADVRQPDADVRQPDADVGKVLKWAPPRSDGQLHCEAHGGPPTLQETAEMVYWRTDIPDDKSFHSSYKSTDQTQYLVFMPDEAGFSNVRLGFETVVALAKATGRTLVLPPSTRIAQLKAREPPTDYYLTDFFDISDIPTMSFQEYLEQEALTGNLRDSTGAVVFPPENRTNWSGLIGNSQNVGTGRGPELWKYISDTSTNIDWIRDSCLVGFTASQNHSTDAIQQYFVSVLKFDEEQKLSPWTRMEQYTGNPIPVDAGPRRRMREMIAERKTLCPYDQTKMEAKSLFMSGLEASGVRPLVPFYAFFFFDDWHQDLQMKRFIRDHVRFADHLQCAAARIVAAVRQKAREYGQVDGGFDSMHVRRTDFADVAVYKDGVVSADQLVSDNYFNDNRTVYVATDEKDKEFFGPLRMRHKLLFLHDFMDLLQGMDPNFYGMIEQLVIARGDKCKLYDMYVQQLCTPNSTVSDFLFVYCILLDLDVGTYYSTFSAYPNRLRGYFALKNKAPGHEQGVLSSEYLGHKGVYRDHMKTYMAVHSSPWSREWPSGWRDIDHDL